MTQTRKLMMGMMIAILFATLITAVFLHYNNADVAAASSDESSDYGVATAATTSCNHTWSHSSATEITASTSTLRGGMVTSPYYYYLKGNVYLTTDITSSYCIEICLNGFTLSGTGSKPVITHDGTLKLYDCSSSGTGKITGGSSSSGGGISFKEGLNSNQFFMYGGTIYNNRASKSSGGGVYMSSGNFTMEGGTISYNNSDYMGGGVCISSGTFTMNGGTISNNTASTYDGGVYAPNVTINGGTISKNTAQENGGGVGCSTFTMTDGTISGNNANNGGGVECSNATMTGGTITGNTAKSKGGGVYYGSSSSAVFYVSGTPKIYSNTSGNIYIPSGKKITVNGELKSGANIRVTLADGEGAFATGYPDTNGDTDPAKYFFADNGLYIVYNNNDELVVSDHQHVYNSTYTNNDSKGKHYQTCTKCDYMLYSAHTTSNSNYKASVNHGENGHWLVCNKCSTKYNQVIHQWTEPWQQADSYHYKECSTCGQQKTEEHLNIVWSKTTDGLTHTGTCNICQKNDIVESCVSDGVIQGNQTGHWSACKTCKGKMGEVQHTEESWVLQPIEGGLRHNAVCKQCDVIKDYSTANHQYTYSDTDNRITHTEVCACGYEKTTEHSFTSGAYKNDVEQNKHYIDCLQCGYRQYSDHTTNNSDFKASVNHSDSGHWLGCNVCGMKYSQETHDWDGKEWQSNVNYHYKECEICTQQKTENHNTRGSSYADNHDEDNHWLVCNVCSEKLNVTSHDWNGSWKAADEYHYQECNICFARDTQEHDTTGSSYAENHDNSGHWLICKSCRGQAGKVVHDWERMSYVLDNNGHHQECEVCKEKSASAEHVLTNVSKVDGSSHKGDCELCSATDVVAAHATSLDYKASSNHGDDGHWLTCEMCDEKYNEVAHDWNSLPYVSDGEEQHHQECKDCQQIKTGNHVSDDGEITKEATCSAVGVKTYSCQQCKAVLDTEDVEMIDHDTSESSYAAKGNHNANEHWLTCSRCGAEVNKASHKWSEQWLKGKDSHYQECEICGQANVEQHSWNDGVVTSDATVEEDGVRTYTCDKCGAIKTESIPATGGESAGDTPSQDGDLGSPSSEINKKVTLLFDKNMAWILILAGIGVLVFIILFAAKRKRS